MSAAANPTVRLVRADPRRARHGREVVAPPRHGRLDELPGSRPAVSFGSLYPALNRLERAGHVKAVTHETSPTPAAPMGGSLAGAPAAFRGHPASAARPAPGRPKEHGRGVSPARPPPPGDTPPTGSRSCPTT